MSVPCKHCGRMVSYDILTQQWTEADKSQYCYVDPEYGSKLHEPTQAQIVTDCLTWAASSDDKFTVPDNLSSGFWLECQLWVTMSMADNFWLKERMQANHPKGKKYHPTHDEQIRAAMEAEFEVCLSPRGMLQLRRGK